MEQNRPSLPEISRTSTSREETDGPHVPQSDVRDFSTSISDADSEVPKKKEAFSQGTRAVEEESVAKDGEDERPINSECRLTLVPFHYLPAHNSNSSRKVELWQCLGACRGSSEAGTLCSPVETRVRRIPLSPSNQR